MDEGIVALSDKNFQIVREDNLLENQCNHVQKLRRTDVEIHDVSIERTSIASHFEDKVKPGGCTPTFQTYNCYKTKENQDLKLGIQPIKNSETLPPNVKNETYGHELSELEQKPTKSLPSEETVLSDNSDSPVVVESLYWQNFLTILKDVQSNENFRDYFLPEEIATLDSFIVLSVEAQKLYVRLISRKHAWFKVSSLKYSDIADSLNIFANELVDKQFLSSDIASEELNSVLDILSLPDLKSLCKNFRLKSEGKKETLVKNLTEFSSKQKQLFGGFGKDIKTVIKEKAVKILGKVIKLEGEPRQLFLRMMLLYSLPLARDMDMEGKIPLLNTMGRVHAKLVAYPDYPFRPLPRVFTSRDALIRYQNALELEAAIKGNAINKKIDEVVELFEHAISRFKELQENDIIIKEDNQLPLFLRSYTAGSVLVKAVYYCIECLRMKKMYSKMVAAYQVLLSQKTYLLHYHGRWYDQLALIYHHHLKNFPMAVDTLLEAMSSPFLSQIDRLLLSNRGLLILNHKSKEKGDMKKLSDLESKLISLENPPEISIQARCLNSKMGLGMKMSYFHETEGEEQALSSVEETVIIHHKKLGYDQGIHAENATSHSLFGIFFWDLLYATDVNHAFICHYQTIPLDLKTGEFFINRKSAVEQRIKDIVEGWSNEEIHSHVEKIWSDQKGKESLVSWRTFEELGLLKNLVECIGREVIAKICKRMAEEYPIARNGFPDVLIWNEKAKKSKFIEVKGPGDRLSPSQRFWLDYLISSGADASVCHVKTVGAKFLKRKLDDDHAESINTDDVIIID